MVIKGEIDSDKFERNIHLFTNLDRLFEGEIVGGDSFIVFVVLVVKFCFIQHGVSDLSFSEVLFCIFNAGIYFS